MKTFFMNDYGEGAHPLVMRRLMETNMEHTCGYGLDEYSLRAADVIREKCGQPGAAVHIMIGRHVGQQHRDCGVPAPV